jgi:hypothetical protein
MPLERALALVRGAALAVDALHARQIVHGSLEPSAFQLDAEDHVSLLPPPDAPARAYWSPQRRAGEPARESDDLYALGLIARALLATVPPDAGEAARLPELDAVLRAHLSWAPSERFASGAALAQELERVAARPPAGQEPPWAAARRVAQARAALRLALATPPAHRPRHHTRPAPLPSHPIIRSSNYPDMPLAGRWVAIVVVVLCSVYLFPLYFMLFQRG